MKWLDFHKATFLTGITTLMSILGVLFWLLTHWAGIVSFMDRLQTLHQLTPKLDSLVQMAPSMTRLVKDYQIIHSLIKDEELQKEDFDSLKVVIGILSYGKAPYQDTVWYMNEYGQWIQCNIKQHPLLNK